MRLYDTHAHLNDEQLIDDLDNVFKNCEEKFVSYINTVGYDGESSKAAILISEKYDNVYAVVGLHPEDAKFGYDLSFVRKFASLNKVIAIGEIGLDFHYDGYDAAMQKEVFLKQIGIANEVGLPVVIHSRDADMEMLQILKETKIDNGFVVHCFSSSVEILREILKLGGYVSIGGAVTFPNANNMINVAREVPIDRLLLETDCPYLTPVPYRGKRNEPAYVYYVADTIASIKKIPVEELADKVLENSFSFFRIKEKN